MEAGPTISDQPVASTHCAGDSATFSVTASGQGTLRYQWYKDDSGHPVGTDSPSCTISPVGTGDAGSYYCVVTDDCSSTTSSGAALTVYSAPTISRQPASAEVCAGGTNTFSVAATGEGLTYQWYTGTPPSGALISGATASNYTTGTAGSYYVIVSGTSPCTSATSTAATLTVDALPAAPADPTANPQAICSGQSSQLSATAGSGETVEWFTGSCGGLAVPGGASPHRHPDNDDDLLRPGPQYGHRVRERLLRAGDRHGELETERADGRAGLTGDRLRRRQFDNLGNGR